MPRLERRPMTDADRAALVGCLQNVRYELLPLGDALVQSSHLPEGAEVAVTADPELGMKPTIDLSVELSGRGFDVIPHLGAQLIRDRVELGTHLERLGDAAIDRALVVGGVASPPGEYFDAMALIHAIEAVGNPLREIGIGGYPEGHHVIQDGPLGLSLLEKAPHAHWITTQICFDVGRTAEWIGDQRARGVDLPIWLGIPGVADVTGLMSLGLRVGAGRSLQFMFEHPRLVARVLTPGGRKASNLVRAVGDLASDETLGIAGFHLFTYNQVAKAERWRRGLLSRLA